MFWIRYALLFSSTAALIPIDQGLDQALGNHAAQGAEGRLAASDDPTKSRDAVVSLLLESREAGSATREGARRERTHSVRRAAQQKATDHLDAQAAVASPLLDRARSRGAPLPTGGAKPSTTAGTKRPPLLRGVLRAALDSLGVVVSFVQARLGVHSKESNQNTSSDRVLYGVLGTLIGLLVGLCCSLGYRYYVVRKRRQAFEGAIEHKNMLRGRGPAWPPSRRGSTRSFEWNPAWGSLPNHVRREHPQLFKQQTSPALLRPQLSTQAATPTAAKPGNMQAQPPGTSNLQAQQPGKPTANGHAQSPSNAPPSGDMDI